jgi:hypothetical protein
VPCAKSNTGRNVVEDASLQVAGEIDNLGALLDHPIRNDFLGMNDCGCELIDAVARYGDRRRAAGTGRRCRPRLSANSGRICHEDCGAGENTTEWRHESLLKRIERVRWSMPTYVPTQIGKDDKAGSRTDGPLWPTMPASLRGRFAVRS